MRKTAKSSARRQKLKDAKAVGNNKETGEGERPKHTGLKPTEAKPTTQSKIDNVTTKITSGSAAGAGTSKGSTTGAGAAGFGAAGAAAGGGGKAGSSAWSAIAKRSW